MGVDPGLSGAVAFYDLEKAAVVAVHDMPLHEVSGKRHIDLYQLAAIIDGHAKDIEFAVIEEVGVMTGKEGVVGMFRFGQAAGCVQGIVAAYMIPMFLVKPSVWKSAMGLTRDKDHSRQKASQLFPSSAHLWARKKDDGRAEALLLAVFGSKVRTGRKAT